MCDGANIQTISSFGKKKKKVYFEKKEALNRGKWVLWVFMEVIFYPGVRHILKSYLKNLCLSWGMPCAVEERSGLLLDRSPSQSCPVNLFSVQGWENWLCFLLWVLRLKEIMYILFPFPDCLLLWDVCTALLYSFFSFSFQFLGWHVICFSNTHVLRVALFKTLCHFWPSLSDQLLHRWLWPLWPMGWCCVTTSALVSHGWELCLCQVWDLCSLIAIHMLFLT